MRFAPIAVALSLLLSSAIIGAALWSTPSMHREFANYDSTQWAKAMGVLLPLLAVCAWPWILAFIRAFGERGSRSSSVFAIAGVLLSVLFYSPISSAPAEGVGYNVIFFLLLAWVAYPISLAAKNTVQ